MDNNYLITIVKKRKRKGRGEGSGLGKTCGGGGKGQTVRTGGGPRPGFEGGQTPVYRRFPKRGGSFKKKTSRQIINLEKLQRDEKITNGQVLDFTKKKSPVKILGKGNFTKTLTIRAVDFSQSVQEKITQAGGEFQTITSIYFDKVMNILRSADFSQEKEKDSTWKWKVMVGEQKFEIGSFRSYVKQLIESKGLKEKWLPVGQKKADLLRRLKELIQAETAKVTK